MTSHRFVLTLAVVAMACAYYNGLYNANHLASEARRAEAEGRRGDARSLWMQAAVRAESVAVRYPDSKYWDDALLMTGMANSRVGECALALNPLSRVVAASDDPSIVEEARLLLAECQVVERQYDAAVVTVTPLANDSSSRYAARASALRGRAELARGNPGAAVRDLTPPRDLQGRFDLAAALLANKQVDLAREQLDLAADRGYDAMRWPVLIDRLGAEDLEAASALVDRWVSDEHIQPSARVQLLIEDADRWTAFGAHDIALNRLSEAADLADDPDLQFAIQFQVAVTQLRQETDASQIAQYAEMFRGLQSGPGVTDASLEAYVDILGRVVRALSAQNSADLFLFRSAEAVRDSLSERDLAVLLFRRVTNDHPTSSIVPKALLAIAQLRPEWTDSILSELTLHYPDSPYTDLATGGVGAGFTALEDSLRLVWARISRDSVGTS